MIHLAMNEGNTDRFMRVVLGSILIAGGLHVWGVTGCIMGIIGLIPLISGLAGWCPLYAIFKIDTCKLSKQ